MKQFLLFLAVLFISLPAVQYAQTLPDKKDLQTESEFQNLLKETEALKKQTQDKTLAGDKRRAAWLSLAQLQLLSGDYAASGASFSEAAFSIPGSRDDGALLRSALCFLYTGDFERASSNIKTILLTSRDEALIPQAQQIGLIIEAFRGDPAALENLSRMVSDPSFKDTKNGLLYILYKLTGKQEYSMSLTKDNGETLEASLLQDPSVSLKYSPLWLFGHIDTLSVESSGPESSAERIAESGVKNATVPQTQTEGPLLQVGLYSQKENAQKMIERLQQKGFQGSLGTRTVNNTSYWIVTVEGGPNYQQKIMQLKDAGFESFPQ